MSEENSENQILVVDDSRVIRRAAVKILQHDFDVIEAADGEEAWYELQNNAHISVVFSDLGMPNMDGFELLDKIRNAGDSVLAKVPVIIITGAEESDGTKEEVLRLGATDFITKPFDSASLKSRATAHINYRKEVKNLEKSVAHDALTGLLTELSFRQQGEGALAYAKRHGTEISLVKFDIDNFSELHERYGKKIAEQIVCKVATLITDGKREEDIAAHQSLSHFSLLLPCSSSDGAELLVGRICQRVSRLKLKLGTDVFSLHFSAGITSLKLDDVEIKFETLLQQSEKALAKALHEGGGKVSVYQGDELIHDAMHDINIDVNLDEMILQIADDDVSNELLAHAMLKILPLLTYADNQLKLDLKNTIHDLKRRLHM
ncbi:hypothetical protein MNBD_GAMMA07-379 [hydrothermal vent metagenome]|uniref:Uncharacterized protein n=1 Tax=hydrothermal vent metagenome TaxID=652676 RepID=A0A3B0WLR5_9ZZZZ